MTWTREKAEALIQRFRIADDAVDAKERKRRKIIAAATKLFLRFGYRKTSMDEVARNAHVAKGTVYLYFASKPELLLHAVAAEKAPLVATFLNIMDEADPHQRLWRYLYETGRAFSRMPLTTQFTVLGNDFEPALAELSPDIATLITEHQTEAFEHLLKPFVTIGDNMQRDITDRTAILLGLIYTMPAMLEKSIASGLDINRAAKIYADILVGGLTASPAASNTQI